MNKLMTQLENTNNLIEIINNTIKENLSRENNQILEKMINKIKLIESFLNDHIKKQLNEDNIEEYKIINIINNQNELFDIINLNQTNIDMVNKYTNAIISNNQKISEIYNNDKKSTNIKSNEKGNGNKTNIKEKDKQILLSNNIILNNNYKNNKVIKRKIYEKNISIEGNYNKIESEKIKST